MQSCVRQRRGNRPEEHKASRQAFHCQEDERSALSSHIQLSRCGRGIVSGGGSGSQEVGEGLLLTMDPGFQAGVRRRQ